MFARAFVRAGLSRPFLRRASNRVGISRSVHAGMASGDETRVAIVGGGVAGIACAQSLVANGFGNRVDIYDQGSRGPGGRTSSSRPVEVNGETMAFDHGAQFFTANDPKFKTVCEELKAKGYVARWDGVFGTLNAFDGVFIPKRRVETSGPPQRDFFKLLTADEVLVGVPTNQAICEGLRALAGDDVTAHWHTTVTGLDRDASGQTWSVSGVNKRRLDEGQAGSKEKRLSGRNAAVVVCDVMAARKGTPGTCAVTGLPERGDAANTWAAFAKVPERVGLFSCMLAFDASAPKPEFDAAVVTGSDVLGLLVRDSSKPGRAKRRDGLERWVAVTTTKFAEETIASAPLTVDGTYNPQTAEYFAKIEPKIVDEARRVLGVACGDDDGEYPAPTHAKCQRWGAAYHSGAVGEGVPGGVCFFDMEAGFGMAGDFIQGPGVEAAWLSGEAVGRATVRKLKAKL